MAANRVRMYRREIAKMLNAEGRYSGVRDDLVRRMEPVLSEAEATAPVDSGDYVDSLEIQVDHTDRVAVRVVGKARHSHLVETQAGTLARAFDAVERD